MKLIFIIGLLLTIASVKVTETEQSVDIASKVEKQETLLPGYGYDIDNSEKKSEDVVVTESDKETEEEVAAPATTAAETTPSKPAETAPSKPAETTPSKPAIDWYTMDCTHENMYHTGIPADQMCNVASAICHGDFANFYELYWCAYNGSMTALLLTYLVFIFLIFKWTGIVVDEYICSGITICSATFGLSDAVAAVTLLALANGAGDVITALVSGSSAGGVSYNIGALYGAGLFVAIPVMCVCVLKAKDGIVYEPVIIFRDIGIYIFSTVLTLVFAAFGYIYWWMAVIFLVVYVVLVVAAVIIDKKDMFTKAKWIKEEEKAAPLNITAILGKVAKQIHAVSSWSQLKKETNNKAAQKLKDASMDDKTWKKFHSCVVDGVITAEERPSCFSRTLNKFMEICDFPYVWLCRLTCLPPPREEWEAWKFYAWPFTGVYFIVSTMTVSFGCMTHLYAGVPVCLVFLAFFVYKLRNNGLETLKEADVKSANQKELTKMIDGINKDDPKENLLKGNDAANNFVDGKAVEAEEGEKPEETCNKNLFNWIAVLVGVVAGLLWTYLLVGLLIDMLNALGIFLNLDSTFLGLTILAVGNALPDALTTISLATDPKAVTMAVSGGYAGQIFGLLIGFGLAQLKQTLTVGPQKFNLFDPAAIQDNLLDLLVLGVALIALLWTFFWGLCNKFHMNKTFAYVGLGLYGAFFVACFIIAISKAIRTY